MFLKVRQSSCEEEQQGSSQSLHSGSQIPVRAMSCKVILSEKCENNIPIIHSLLLRINEIEPKYYADGEDAYAMKRDLVVWSKQQVGYIPLIVIRCASIS